MEIIEHQCNPIYTVENTINDMIVCLKFWISNIVSKNQSEPTHNVYLSVQLPLLAILGYKTLILLSIAEFFHSISNNISNSICTIWTVSTAASIAYCRSFLKINLFDIVKRQKYNLSKSTICEKLHTKQIRILKQLIEVSYYKLNQFTKEERKIYNNEHSNTNKEKTKKKDEKAL